jgi:hypothetical protein
VAHAVVLIQLVQFYFVLSMVQHIQGINLQHHLLQAAQSHFVCPDLHSNYEPIRTRTTTAAAAAAAVLVLLLCCSLPSMMQPGRWQALDLSGTCPSQQKEQQQQQQRKLQEAKQMLARARSSRSKSRNDT